MTACLVSGLTPLVPARADEPAGSSQAVTPAWVPGHEVVSMRDRFGSTVMGDSPGTYSSKVYSAAVNFKASDGTWQPIDLSLKSTPNGIVPAANDFRPSFGLTGSEDALVRAPFSAAQQVTFGLAGALPVPGVVSGDTVTYPQILPGVDASYLMRTGAVKETLVLRSADAPTSFEFPLTLSGLQAHGPDADGAVHLLDSPGSEVALIPPGEMRDASKDPTSGDPAESRGVDYQVLNRASGPVLRVSIDRTWLQDPARVFPVSVDPTVYSVNYPDGGDDAYVQSSGGYSYTDTELKSGTYNGSDKSRSFMHFAGVSTFDGRQINSATLNIYETWSYSCTARGVHAWPLAAAWDGTISKTWPGVTLRPFDASYVPEAIVAHGYSSSCPAANVPWNVTQTVKNWANNTWPNYGIALLGSSESDASYWKKWAANEAPGYAPYIAVNWTNSAPAQVSGRSVTPNDCAYNCSTVTLTKDTTPVLRGATTDPDAQLLRYDFEVYPGHIATVDGSGNATPGAVVRLQAGSVSGLASGAVANWTVPTALADGDYSYRVRAYDGELYSVWSSGWSQFTVDSSPPSLPDIQSSTHPSESSYYSAADIAARWPSTAVAGLNGYTTILDTVTGTDPGTSNPAPNDADTFTGKPDRCYYLHARAQNNVGVWGSTSQREMCIHTTVPNPPTYMSSSSHGANTPSNVNRITLSAGGATDQVVNASSSGIAGYAMACDSLASSTVVTIPWTSGVLGDGDHYCHTRAVDKAGNVSSDVASVKYVIDTTVPLAPSWGSTMTATDSVWASSNSPQFSWLVPSDASGIAGYWVGLCDQGPPTSPSITQTSTSFSFTNLSDGKHVVCLLAQDVAQNWSAVRQFNLWVDATVPVAPLVSSTTHSSGVWSTNNIPSFHLQGSDTSSILGYSYVIDTSPNTIPTASTTTDSTHTYVAGTSYDFTASALPEGKNYLHVRARNGALLFGDTATFAIWIDRSAPNVAPTVVSTSGHVVGQPTNKQALSLSWTAQPGSDLYSGVNTFRVSVVRSDGTIGCAQSDQPQTTYSCTLPSEGDWYFHIRAIHALGWVGADTVVGPYKIDLTAPAAAVITSTTHPNNTWSSATNGVFILSSADASGVTGYSVILDESQNTVWTPTKNLDQPFLQTSATFSPTGITDGYHYLHVRALDSAGNWSNPAIWTVLVDSTGPVITSLTSGTHPAIDSQHPLESNWSSNNTPTFTFNSTDTGLSGIVGWLYSVDSDANGLPTLNTNLGAVSQGNFTLPAMNDGAAYFHIRAVNGAGALGPVLTYLLRIDHTAPSQPTAVSPDHDTGDATNQNVITMDWSAQPGADAASGVTGYLYAFTNSSSTPTSGYTSIVGTRVASAPLADGQWYFHLKAFDLVGNQSSDFVFGPVTIDSTAPPVGSTNAARFIQLWKPRVTSDTFYVDYLASPTYSSAILAEGFHGYNAVQKQYLIDQLMTSLLADDSVGPEVSSTVDGVKAQLLLFVFNKSQLPPAETASNLVDTITDLVSELAPSTSPLLDQLDAVKGIVPALPSLDLPELPDVGLEDVTPDLEDAIDPAETDVAVDLSSETLADLSAIDTQLSDVTSEVQSQVDQIVASSAPIDPTPLFDLVGPLPVDGGYTVCWQTSSKQGCQKVAAVGAAAPVDLTGDNTPDVLTTFGPTVDASNPGSVGFSLRVQRSTLPGSDLQGKMIKARVYVIYDVPANNTRLNLGFDGLRRGERLADDTTAAFTLTQPTRLAEKDLFTAYRITHVNPGATWALTLGRSNLTGDADPTEASLQFTPPRAVSGNLNLINDDNTSANPPTRDRREEITTSTSASASASDTFTLDLVGTQTISKDSEKMRTAARFEQLPTQASFSLSDTLDGQGVHTYRALVNDNDTVGSIKARAELTTGTTVARLAAVLSNVPKTLDYTMTNTKGRVRHIADDSGLVGAVALAADIRSAGVLQLSASGQLMDLPAHVDLWYGPSDKPGDDSLLGAYTATPSSSNPTPTVPLLSATAYDRTLGVTVRMNLREVPPAFTFNVSKSLKHAEVKGTLPFGWVDLSAARGRGTVYRPSGEHLTYVSDGTNVGVSARVTGLQAIQADVGDTLHATATTSPGGQHMTILGQLAADYLFADLSNMPTALDAVVDRPNLHAHYTGSSAVPTMRMYAGRRPGGPHLEAKLSQVPTDIDLQGTLTSDKVGLHYIASAPLSSIDRFVFTTDGTPGDKHGVTLLGSATRIPREVTASVDRTLRKAQYDSDAPLGVLKLTATRNGAKAQTAAGDHMTLNGTAAAWAADAQITGLKSASVDLSQGVTHSTAALTVSPGGQSFVLNANVDSARLYANVSRLPATFTATADSLNDLTFDASGSIPKLTLYAAKVGVGPTVQGVMNNAPSGHMTADVVGPTYAVHFNSPTPVTNVTGFYSTKYVDRAASPVSDFISMTGKGLVSSLTATLDTTNKHLSFVGDRGMDQVTWKSQGLLVHNLATAVTLTNLPAAVDLDYNLSRSQGNLLFDAHGGTLGTAVLQASNHGPLPQLRSGQHLRAHYDDTNANFDATARLTNISSVKVSNTGCALALDGAVDLGSQSLTLDLWGKLNLGSGACGADSGTAPGLIIAAKGTLNDFPTNLSLTADGDGVTYRANKQLDAHLTGEIGYGTPIVAARALPFKRVHGVGLVTESCGAAEGCNAVGSDGRNKVLCPSRLGRCLGARFSLDYEGLPTSLLVNFNATSAPLLEMSGANPATPDLNFSAVLSRSLPGAKSLAVAGTQAGVVANKAMSIGPISFDGAFHAEMHNQVDLGKLTATFDGLGSTFDFNNFRFTDVSGSLTLDSVPAYSNITTRLGATSQVNFKGSHGVVAPPGEPALFARLKADVSHKDNGSYSLRESDAVAAVSLFDLPGDPNPNNATDLKIVPPPVGENKGQVIAVPDVHYKAVASTLDGGVTIPSSMLQFGAGGLEIALGETRLEFTDMAKTFDVDTNTSTWANDVTTTAYAADRTKRLFFRSDALDASYDKDVGPVFSKPGVGKVMLQAQLHLTAHSNTIELDLTDVHDLHLIPGTLHLAYGVTGDFGQLKVGLPGFGLTGSAFAGVRVRTAPDWNWRADSFRAGVGINVNNLSVDFRVTDATQFGNTPFCFRGTIGHLPYNVRLQVRPAPTSSGTKNGFTITGGPGQRHLVTYIPHNVPGVAAEWSGLVDIISALYLSPPSQVDPQWTEGDWKLKAAVGWSC